jgi:predicted RNA-binding Zn ribbon-like protein
MPEKPARNLGPARNRLTKLNRSVIFNRLLTVVSSPIGSNRFTEVSSVPDSSASLGLIGGRLSLDFANELSPSSDFSWEELLRFLLVTKIISSERSAQLLALPQNDPRSAGTLLGKAQRLHASLHMAFSALLRREALLRDGVEPINEVLRVTEGHDEILEQNGKWGLEFVAREGGLDWLLAAIARSAAELIAEGASARLRVCSNPDCGLFFYDTSRTRGRRWCSMSRCGNRHKVRAFSRRHSAGRR